MFIGFIAYNCVSVAGCLNFDALKSSKINFDPSTVLHISGFYCIKFCFSVFMVYNCRFTGSPNLFVFRLRALAILGCLDVALNKNAVTPF